KEVAVGGVIEWLWSIGYRARNQTALAVVTNTGAARPTNRDIASLGQLQDALVGGRLPMGCDAASRERYQRTGFGVALGRMWDAYRRADETRVHRLAATEDFSMNPLGRHT